MDTEEISVRKATPAETAKMLLRNYDAALAAQVGHATQLERRRAIDATLRAAARLADFVATQYNID